MTENNDIDNRMFSTQKMDKSIEKYLSKLSKSRTPSIFREMHNLSVKLPEKPINLVSGFPHQEVFPIRQITLDLQDGSTVTLPPEVMKDALQYHPGFGYAPFLEKIREMTVESHNPPFMENRELLVTNGAQEGVSKIIDMVVEEGDGVVLPEHIYTATNTCLHPLKPKYLCVPCDNEGMLADELEAILEENYKTTKIKLLYMITTGSNPTGVTTSHQRRKLIYALACKYDFLILEDDPYCVVNLDDEELPPSFLQLDVDMRVLRVDSFSKSMGPGFRVGWVTAPSGFIPRIQRHQYVATMHPSTLSQAILHSILTTWGKEGLDNHISKMKKFYSKRRKLIVDAATKHLTGLAEWNTPSAGMFLWLKFTGMEDSCDLILKDLLQAGVMLCPGNYFHPDTSTRSPYARCSFSFVKEEEFDEAFKITAQIIRKKMAAKNGK